MMVDTQRDGGSSGKLLVPPKVEQPKAKQVKTKAPPKVKPDPKGLSIGKSSGKKVCEFWGILLTQNAKAHLTDEALVKKFFAEFPLRGYIQPVPRYRSWFNCGTYANLGLAPNGEHKDAGKKPPVKSVSYLPDGTPTQKAKAEQPKSIPNPNAPKQPVKVAQAG